MYQKNVWLKKPSAYFFGKPLEEQHQPLSAALHNACAVTAVCPEQTSADLTEQRSTFSCNQLSWTSLKFVMDGISLLCLASTVLLALQWKDACHQETFGCLYLSSDSFSTAQPIVNFQSATLRNFDVQAWVHFKMMLSIACALYRHMIDTRAQTSSGRITQGLYCLKLVAVPLLICVTLCWYCSAAIAVHLFLLCWWCN